MKTLKQKKHLAFLNTLFSIVPIKRWGFMTIDLNVTDISALLMVLFTFVITAANVLLWLATRRNIKLQISSNYSQNHQALVHGHRDLFLGLLHQPSILEKFAAANAIDIEKWEQSIIASLFINQAFVHFLNFTNGTVDRSYMAGFKQDAREIFSIPTVYAHWQKSKVWYSDKFRIFVDEELFRRKQEPANRATPPTREA